MEKLKVLFICRDNSIRAPLAAGFLNAYFGDRYEAYSCGIEPREINPLTIKVMKEIGINSFSNCAKSIEEFRDKKFDCIITLCDFVKINLPTLPEHRKQLHHSFKDFCIPALCQAAGKSKMCFPQRKKTGSKGSCDSKEIEKDILSAFRYLREAIFNWVENEAVF